MRRFTIIIIALAAVLALTMTTCENEADSDPTYEYGPGGGIIFYHSEAGFTMTDDPKVYHYLEAALTDFGALAWATEVFESTGIAGTETGFGTGKKNTALILAVDENAPAAKACDTYSKKGCTDWFLPSKDELNVLYEFYAAHGSGSYANFKRKDYWSSSQKSSDYAWAQDFYDGEQSEIYKWWYQTVYVRAIRAY